jgi:type II secretory pathway component PulF
VDSTSGAPVGGQADWASRASAQQVSLFFRQMHAMLHAGTSLARALETCALHGASAPLRRASARMASQAGQGVPWSDSLRGYPGLFSPLAAGLVSLGEGSGRLDLACLRLSEYYERDYAIQQAIKRETWYPKLLLGCAIFVPSVVPLVLGGLGAWWASIAPTLLLLGGLSLGWKAISWAAPLAGHEWSWRLAVDRLKLRFPVAGKVVRAFASAKFCRGLGAAYGAGMRPQKALRLAADAAGNEVLRLESEKAGRQVEEGTSLSGALAGTGFLPPVALQMLATGEQAGRVDEQLEKVADFLEGDAETAVRQAVKALGVAVLLFVGLRIGRQVVAFYTSYFGGLMGDVPL